MSVVVSDTSPLHYLILCDSVEALPRLFRQVVIPPMVFQELQQPRTPAPVRAWVQSLPEWVQVQAPTTLDRSLAVDPGELEAICLALEIKAAALLMDDRAGRTAAQRCGLAVTGTIGILEMAASRGCWIYGKLWTSCTEPMRASTSSYSRGRWSGMPHDGKESMAG